MANSQLIDTMNQTKVTLLSRLKVIEANVVVVSHFITISLLKIFMSEQVRHMLNTSY